MQINFLRRLGSSCFSVLWRFASAGTVLFVFAFAFALPVFPACQQVNIPVYYVTSWDSYGIENKIRVEESWRPDQVAGKGPYSDRYDYTRLRISYNVLAFQIPQFTGTVASAELRLQARYVVSVRGTEIYQCGALTDDKVKLALHRRLPVVVYDDAETNAVYGSGVVSIVDQVVKLQLSPDFISKITTAQGGTFLMQGVVTSLDGDPHNPEYLYAGDYPTSLVLTLASNAVPEISSQPVSRNVGAGTDVDFAVSACGATPLSYQWRYNGGPLTGATNSSLVLPRVSEAQAGNYTVVLSNSFGSITSVVAALQVFRAPPYFVSVPTDLTTSAGETNVYLRGAAGGAPPPSYQWRFEGVDLPGATNNSLTFSPTLPANSGHYTLIASNSSGSVTSTPPALLTVVPFFLNGPYISGSLLSNQITISMTAYGRAYVTNWMWFHNGALVTGESSSYLSFIATYQSGGDYFAVGFNQYGAVTSSIGTLVVETQAPVFSYILQGEQEVVAGLTTYLDSTASGGPPPSYQWYHNGLLIPGQVNAVLTFTNNLAASGQYFVVASNEIGKNTNGPITISVVAAKVYANPSFNNVGAGSVLFLRSYYEGVQPVSYQWYFDGQFPTGTNAVSFNGVALAGETNANLLLPGIATNQAGFYAVAVSNAFGRVVSEPAQVDVYTSTPGANVAAALTARTGDFTWISAYLYGAPPPACQWQFNGVNIPGATNQILALSNLSTQQSGDYSLVVSNVFGTATSSAPAHLEVIMATPLDDWSAAAPNPQPNPLTAVAFGGGRRVAVGENGAVLVSTDGLSWTARHLGRGIHLEAITYGNGTFVAVGHADVLWYDLPVILTSLDGMTWRADHLSASGRLTGVAFGNNRFVVTGGAEGTPSGSVNLVLTSSDAVNWNNHYLPAYVNYLAAICFGNGLFVAVSDLANAFQASIFYSTDGADWRPGSANANRDFEAVAAANNSFIAAGDKGGIGRSSDGINWTVGPINYATPFKAVGYGNGTYVAAGEGGSTLVSNDALSWHPVSVPSGHDINGLTFGGGQFTAVCDAGRILVSSNAQDWADQCLGADSDLFGIAQGTNSFVAVGDGAILQSTDGVDWIRVNLDKKLHGVTYGNGLYVAVGKKGAILTSPDGLTWTTRSVSSTGYVERVLWANNQFVGVGEGGLIVTSPDGLAWTKLPDQTPSELEGVAYGNGIYVAVGGYFPNGAVTTVLTSSDAVRWFSQGSVSFFGVRARGVTFGNGRFVMVGNDGLTATSTNGQFWTDHFLTVAYNNLRAVTFTAGYFVAVGNDGLVASSTNGLDWVVNRCPASMNLRDVIATPDFLIAVGSNGAFWQSGELRPAFRARLVPAGFEMNISGGLIPECKLQGSSNLRDWTDLFTYTNTAPATFLDTEARVLPNRSYRLIPR